MKVETTKIGDSSLSSYSYSSSKGPRFSRTSRCRRTRTILTSLMRCEGKSMRTAKPAADSRRALVAMMRWPDYDAVDERAGKKFAAICGTEPRDGRHSRGRTFDSEPFRGRAAAENHRTRRAEAVRRGQPKTRRRGTSPKIRTCRKLSKLSGWNLIRGKMSFFSMRDCAKPGMPCISPPPTATDPRVNFGRARDWRASAWSGR